MIVKQVFHAQIYHSEDIFHPIKKQILKKMGTTGFEPVTNKSGACRDQHFEPNW